MLEIRVNKTDYYFYTKINADLEETAKYYFQMHDVESIDILRGGTFENEFFKKTPIQIWKADPEIVEEFELNYNIRLSYRVDYKNPLPDGTTTIENSCGLCRIA